MIGFLFLILPSSTLRAAYKEVKLSATNSIVFKNVNQADSFHVYKDGDWAELTSAVSSNEKIATTSIMTDKSGISIDAHGKGTCIVNISDQTAKRKTLKLLYQMSMLSAH